MACASVSGFSIAVSVWMVEAVVFANEKQRHRQTLMLALRRGVEGALSGGMVRRSVAETAHRDGIGRPSTFEAKFAGPVDGEGHTQRPRQMGRNRRRLRNHIQLAVAENLVSAPGHRFVRRRGDAEHHVTKRMLSGHLPRTLDIEGAGSIMQESRIRRPKTRRDSSVSFVPCRSDRVETFALGAQPTGGNVEMPAAELRIEHIQQPSGLGLAEAPRVGGGRNPGRVVEKSRIGRFCHLNRPSRGE